MANDLSVFPSTYRGHSDATGGCNNSLTTLIAVTDCHESRRGAEGRYPALFSSRRNVQRKRHSRNLLLRKLTVVTPTRNGLLRFSSVICGQLETGVQLFYLAVRYLSEGQKSGGSEDRKGKSVRARRHDAIGNRRTAPTEARGWPHFTAMRCSRHHLVQCLFGVERKDQKNENESNWSIENLTADREG